MSSSETVKHIQEKWALLVEFLWGWKSSTKIIPQKQKKPNEEKPLISAKLIKDMIDKMDLNETPQLPKEIEKSFDELEMKDLLALSHFLIVLAQQETNISEVYKIGKILTDYAKWIDQNKNTVYVDEILKRNCP